MGQQAARHTNTHDAAQAGAALDAVYDAYREAACSFREGVPLREWREKLEQDFARAMASVVANDQGGQ